MDMSLLILIFPVPNADEYYKEKVKLIRMYTNIYIQ